MGSIVTYRCSNCSYATEQLKVGWGKSGRASYWGGLALCGECAELTAVNLAERRTDQRDRRCARCNAPLKMLEGTAEGIACPRCRSSLQHARVGDWA